MSLPEAGPISITESGMTFGPFPVDHLFYVEKSEIYQKLQDRVKIAEFALLRMDSGQPRSLWIVEAKSSAPQPATIPNFDEFLREICEKLVNAFNITLALSLGRHAEYAGDLPPLFKSLDLSSAGFRLILVINGHQTDWLPPLRDALVKLLRLTLITWDMTPLPVVVLNQELAEQYGLILASTDASLNVS